MEYKDMRIGMRVMLEPTVTGPACRVGVVKTVERGGGLIRHDDGSVFCWMAHELMPADRGGVHTDTGQVQRMFIYDTVDDPDLEKLKRLVEKHGGRIVIPVEDKGRR